MRVDVILPLKFTIDENLMQSTDTSPKAFTSEHYFFNKQHFQDHVEQVCTSSLETFKQITQQYAFFHILFFAIGLLEFFAFVLFFSFFTKSALFAFTIAGLFFTGFVYFVLLFYFQAKKPQQLLELRNAFVEQCKAALPFEKHISEYHEAQIHASYYLLSQFHRQEYAYYSLPAAFQTLSLLTKKFSAWAHWKDVYQIKEMFLLMIIKEQIKLVQIKPTDLEVHAGLATSFISLAKLCMDPRKNAPEEYHPWVSPEYQSDSMREKFTHACLRAIEELHILDAYAHNDLWIHSQLASVYHDLGMTEQEIKEYETILALAPKDQNILLRLGILYFSQGQNAQALHLYEKLQGLSTSKAEQLLSHYGAAFIENDPFEEY